MTILNMTILDLFHLLIAGHILFGATGALAFWVPVLGRKGGVDHKRWGKVFTLCMLVTGGFACAMSLATIHDPMGTHPHLVGKLEPAIITGIFGWMMLYLAVLTINLAWYGWLCVRNKRDHAANSAWHNMALQAILTLAAANCVVQGLRIGQPLMLLSTGIGFATVATNLYFIMRPPAAKGWLKEHIKALVGAGISVYTAFFAFGAVRTIPALALNPILWAIPLAVGLALILYHRRAVSRGVV